MSKIDRLILKMTLTGLELWPKWTVVILQILDHENGLPLKQRVVKLGQRQSFTEFPMAYLTSWAVSFIINEQGFTSLLIGHK